MRKAFVTALTEVARRDPRVTLVVADTGFHVFDDYQIEFADRFYNTGVTEAATIGLATGLAMNGRIVYVYGIAPFVTMRCFEQIRNDVCFHNARVRMVGVGQGVTYASEGATHHSRVDIALMSSLPNMTVICPGDPHEARALTLASVERPGGVYLRLGKSSEPTVHDGPLDELDVGRGVLMRSGSDVAIMSTGNMLPTAVAAADRLADHGVDAALLSMPCVKPLDTELLGRVAGMCSSLVTIEEHGHLGGLGAAVSAHVHAAQLGVDVLRVAMSDDYINYAGSHDYVRGRFGLTPEAIAGRVLERLKR